MAIETTYLAEYIQTPHRDTANYALSYSPGTFAQVYGSVQAEYRFSALARPQFTGAEQQVAVYLSAGISGGSVRIEVRRGTHVLASRTEPMTSSHVGATGGKPTILAFHDPGGSTADIRLHLLSSGAYARLHYAQLTADTTMPVVEASGRAGAVSGTSARPLRQRHVLPALGFDAVSATSGHVWVQRPNLPPAPMWLTDGSPLEAWFTDGAPLPDPALITARYLDDGGDPNLLPTRRPQD